jgi:hypothetical protein
VITQQEFLERLERNRARAKPLERTEMEAAHVERQTFGSTVDLSNTKFLGPLRFVNCEFKGDVLLEGALLATCP